MTHRPHQLITITHPARPIAIAYEGTRYVITSMNIDDEGRLRGLSAVHHAEVHDADYTCITVDRLCSGRIVALMHYPKSITKSIAPDALSRFTREPLPVLRAAAHALRDAQHNCSDDEWALLAQGLVALDAAAAELVQQEAPAPARPHGFERTAAQIYHLTPADAHTVRGDDATPKEPQMRLKNCSAKLSDLNVANAWKVQRDPTSRRPKKYVSFTLKVVAHLYTRDQVKQLIPGLADMMPNLLDQATDASPEDLIKMSLKRMFDTAIWIFKGEDEDGLEVRVELQADIKGAPTITLGGTCEVAFKLTGKCERSRWMEMHELLAAENITVTTAALQQDLLAGLSLHPGGLTYTIGDAS